jgi:hypothetical protein
MSTKLLTEKYADDLFGVLNCYDRVIINGSVRQWSYAKGMTSYLYGQKTLIFDYTKFAEPLRDAVRQNAQVLAEKNGLEIEFISKHKAFRKEARIKAIISERGEQPGLVHIFSAMEPCQAYRPWHDKQSHKTFVKTGQSKCLHYYFYFIDPAYGLCYLRVPTWVPFRLQFYFNGHNALAAQLKQTGIGFEQIDNALVQIDDFDQANQLAQTLDIDALYQRLNELAAEYCPVVDQLGQQYHWSISQAEYATDLVFKTQSTLQAFYPRLLEILIQAVKPADVATFLGRKLHSNYQDELGNRFNQRWLGSRLKHQMGPISLKLYDKFNIILRLETTVNDVSFFQQYRQVQHRDNSVSTKYAPMKKTIYSWPALAETLRAVHKRYLKFISEIDTPDTGLHNLQHLTESRQDNDHRYKGFNLLSEEDTSLFRLLLNGAFVLKGFSNKLLRQHLPDKSAGQITRLFKRLRVHGLIKRAGKCYRYYLTDFGRTVATTALKLRELIIIPQLASCPAQ